MNMRKMPKNALFLKSQCTNLHLVIFDKSSENIDIDMPLISTHRSTL
jgi:hypothetical protein